MAFRPLGCGIRAPLVVSALALAVVAGATEIPEVESQGSGVDELRIEIHKAERELLLYSGGALIGRYPVGLGFHPIGHKHEQGDGATPEGRYSVCVKNPRSRYYLSLGIDYPSVADADGALARGRISVAEHRSIVRAHRRGGCPPWGTTLGGEIFIHGRGASSDWTLGCIALDDADMKVLFERVRLGTEVLIKAGSPDGARSRTDRAAVHDPGPLC